MREEDKEVKSNHDYHNLEQGEHIDIRVGKENNLTTSYNSDQYKLEEILTQMYKQTEYLSQIKNIVTYLFSMLIIAAAVAVIVILTKIS